MSELLADKHYRKFVQRNVSLPLNVQHGQPWMIMARRVPDVDRPTWARKLMPTYKDAYYKMRELVEDPGFEDVSIISRRVLFGPPLGFTWSTGRYAWCGRCRRPTTFTYALRHPALAGSPVLSFEDPFRCFYCGMREVSMPRYHAQKLNKG